METNWSKHLLVIEACLCSIEFDYCLLEDIRTIHLSQDVTHTIQQMQKKTNTIHGATECQR